MQTNKRNERGSVMVEAIAVVALLGLMGTLLYRQVKSRNEELDNINMASEIRMVKDATAAYLQAEQAMISADCVNYDGRLLDDEKDDIDTFLPYNWQSDDGDGIINYFNIWLTCSAMDEELAPGRNAISATIIPQADTLPPSFNLKRASRVANLIGSDGGIYIVNKTNPDDATLNGTMGAWEVGCDQISPATATANKSGGKSICAYFNSEIPSGKNINATFVATTGLDIYIPESDTPDNTVTVPRKMAFEELHSTDYFSVGSQDYNCVSNYGTPTANKFAHEVKSDAGEYARDDNISRVGETGTDCDPLFWVGEAGNPDDNSDEGHVYVKNNLYIGRDNANFNQAVAIETDDSTVDTAEKNAHRQISVYDTDGNARLILNAEGQIVGRKASNGSGYRLDPKNGEIVLFQEYTLSDGHIVQLPTLRLANNRMETTVKAQYPDATDAEVYAVDPAGTSLMNDIRLISRGGAKLSDILPDYIAKGISSIQDTGSANSIDKPTCPTGYVRAITVTPVRSSQDVTKLELSEVAGSVSGTTSKTSGSAETKADSDSGAHQKLSGDGITLTQHAPVNITINGDASASAWSVALKYGNKPATSSDPITALVHTYCVYDSENFDSDTTVSASVDTTGMKKETGIAQESKTEHLCPPKATESTCNTATEVCHDGYCIARPTCDTSDNGKKIGAGLYCIAGHQVYLECFTDADCHGTTCDTTTYQCEDPS